MNESDVKQVYCSSPVNSCFSGFGQSMSTSTPSQTRHCEKIPKRFAITLRVLGDIKIYDLRYLYNSILKNNIDPVTGAEFTAYQLRRIKMEYKNRLGLQ